VLSACGPATGLIWKTLILVSDRLRQRFHITHDCVIADRGTIPAETVELEARKLLQLLASSC
jgi:hypothetical protein